jgi:hypothetical protein
MKRIKLTAFYRFDLTDENRRDLADALDLSLHHLELDLKLAETREGMRHQARRRKKTFRAEKEQIKRQLALHARFRLPHGK